MSRTDLTKLIAVAGGVILLPVANSAIGETLPQAPQAPAEQTGADVPRLEADSQTFDGEKRQLTSAGNAVLRHDGIELRSHEVVFDNDSGTATAAGNVFLARKGFRLLSPDAFYNYKDRSFGAKDFRLGQYPLYVKGKKLSGTVEDIHTEDTTVYFNEPDTFGINLHASKTRLKDRSELELDSVTFRLGQVPFFYLPSYAVGEEANAPVSISARAGYNSDLGAFLQTQTLVRLYEGLGVGPNLDGYTARGVLVGPVLSYEGAWGDGSFIRTFLDSGYINDNGSTRQLSTDIMGNPVERNRFFADWVTQGALGTQVDFLSVMRWWSDSEVTRDFRDDLFNHNPNPDNYAEAAYRGSNFIVSAFARYNPNSWEQTQQRLPEVRFNLMPTEVLETGVYQRLDASYAYLKEKDPNGAQPELTSNRLNLYYGLSRTFSTKDWFSFTPVAGVMVTHYADLNPGSTQSSYTRVLGEVGFDAQMLLSRRWALENEVWGINGLRHQMRPVVQYRYIPAAQSGNTMIPPIDRAPVFQTYLDPIGLANRRDIDDLYEQNTLRIGLENVLQTRSSGSYGSRQLVELNIYQQFNFARRPAGPGLYNNPPRGKQNDFSNLYTELKVTPADWISFGVFTRIDPTTLETRQVSTYTRLIDTDQWTAYVGNDYIEDAPGSMINQYVLGGSYRLNDRNMVYVGWRIDGALSELTEQYYGWQHRLGNSWLISTQIGYLSGTDRNGNFQFRIRADYNLY